jgi:hypothetical protein
MFFTSASREGHYSFPGRSLFLPRGDQYSFPRRPVFLPEGTSIPSRAGQHFRPALACRWPRQHSREESSHLRGHLRLSLRLCQSATRQDFLVSSRGDQYSFPSGSVFPTNGATHRSAWKYGILRSSRVGCSAKYVPSRRSMCYPGDAPPRTPDPRFTAPRGTEVSLLTPAASHRPGGGPLSSLPGTVPPRRPPTGRRNRRPRAT